MFESRRWNIDSGATVHMTYKLDAMIEYVVCTCPYPVTFSDGNGGEAIGAGNVIIDTHVGLVTSRKVLYVPTIKVNIVALAAVLKRCVYVSFPPVTHAVNFTCNGKTIATGSVLRKIFWLDVNKPVAYTAATDVGVSWHKCVGHSGVPALTAMQKQGLLGTNLIDLSEVAACGPCKQGKFSRVSPSSSKVELTFL